MNSALQRTANLIGPDATLHLREPRGRTLVGIAGRLWITQHGDARDIFVAAGERYTFDRGGDALVQALGPDAAVVAIEAPAAREPLAAAGRWLAAQAGSVLARGREKLRPGPAPRDCAGCPS